MAIFCVLPSSQVLGTWAANRPRQAGTPQCRALGQKAFTLHTSKETPAGPGTCSERLVTRARPSSKRWVNASPLGRDGDLSWVKVTAQITFLLS